MSTTEIKRRLVCTRLAIFAFLIFVIVFRLNTEKPKYKDADRVRITSRVTLEPVKYETAQGVQIMQLRAYLDLYPEINYGDVITVEGVVEGNKLNDPSLIKINKATLPLYTIRNKIINLYRGYLPNSHAALVAGITIGSKQLISQEFWETLKRSGTAHVVVASGMNVTMVAAFLMNILVLFTKRRKAIAIALVGVWGYAILSGFDAPIVRAAVMGSVAFSAQALGRLSSAMNALFVSALLMLLVKPVWIYDLGFILSFLATLSLILFEPPINRLIHKVPVLFREGLSTSLAAQIGVSPVLYLYFGQVNILSPLINALILWTVVPIMIIGSVGGVVGLIFEPLGRLITLLVYPFTWWFVKVVNMFG